MIADLTDFGVAIATGFWVPILAWSVCVLVAIRILTNRTHPIAADVRYVAAVALLVGLPFGLVAGQLFGGFAPAPGLALASDLQSGDNNKGSGSGLGRESSSENARASDAFSRSTAAGTSAEKPNETAAETAAETVAGAATGTAAEPVVGMPGQASGPDAHGVHAARSAQESLALSTASKTSTSSTTSANVLRFLFVLIGIVTCILFLYAAIRAGRLIAQLSRVSRLRLLPEADDSAALRRFNGLRSRVVRGRSVRLLAGPDTLAPMTFGLLRPVVVVPSKLLRDAPAFEAAVAHELQHVRRNDYAVGLFLRLITLPVSWHPLVGSLLREMEDARESLCDYRVIGEGGVTLQVYATTLLHFARTRSPKQFHPALAAPSGQLKKRIEAMRQTMNDRTPVRFTRRALPTLVGTLLLGLALFVTACSSPSESSQTTTVSSDASASADLPKLELQVEYLIQEIQRLEEESDAMLATVDGRDEEIDIRRTIAWSVLQQRRALLGGVLSEKLRERELARMEAAVGLTVTG